MQRARTDEAKDERRQVLLKAALDEFFERGFAAARMDDIARRAGLSKGALYLYFDSKEALFTALIETVAVPNVERVEEAIAAAPSVEVAVKALMTFAPMLIQESPLPRVAKVLLADAGAFPEITTRYRRDVIERLLAAITALLERGNASGEIAVGDPKLAARLVVAPVVLSAIWHVVFETEAEARVDHQALFALHGQMLLRGLSHGGGGSP